MRMGLVVMGLAMGAVVLIGAASAAQELTARSLRIVDADGKERFGMVTMLGGTASFTVSDADGKVRFRMLTTADGMAGLEVRDRKGKMRFLTTTAHDGRAHFMAIDRKGGTAWAKGTE
jgi:hypothetical protein